MLYLELTKRCRSIIVQLKKKTAVAIPGSLNFYTNFRMNLHTAAKKPPGILIGIALSIDQFCKC